MSGDLEQNIVKIKVKGGGEIVAFTHQTLHSALAAAGIILESVCGGAGTCGKCKVRIISGRVADLNGKPTAPEEDGQYLACQVYPLEDLVLDTIKTHGVSAKGEIGGMAMKKSEINPPVKKICFKPEYPDLLNNYSLEEMIKKSGLAFPPSISALKDLAVVSLPNPGELTATVIFDEITCIENGNTSARLFGVAFDIGSTTVAGMLLDINKGKVIAAAAETNPQTAFGADVVSRIKAASTGEGLEKLSSLIRECLNTLISDLCGQAGITAADIYLVTIAGNSTMEHLLMGISPSYLCQSPYAPVFNYIPPLSPENLKLNINPGAKVVLLPNIASFVGADTVAAITAEDQDLTDKMTLLLDLGTNGELAIGNQDKIVVCSTAAGPAFEGAELACGMRAGEGAIDNVIITDDVHVTTVKNAKPRGICGSGVIKAIAELIKAGVIDSSGRFLKSSKVAELPPLLRERIQEKDGQKVFILTFAGESATGGDVFVSQGDIRQIQLVKSSIRTGAEILMENIGVAVHEVQQVLIAGAFGNYIDLDSALAIGLIPQTELSVVHPVGNAAGAGAVKALLSKRHLDRCYAVAKKAGFIELANHPKFRDKFMKNLSF
ncbi:MAG: ASKHA domain-containing protein [Thermincola sp.]|jgi:uncharacterized 2Fe-2S/4Fe-4S cluster protein (DUF4445 family)|nr:ASKHA domain-containing protein [Thermincola sp.]MDT3701990.1 ASKHA domain-containing protein [Thermincola sp.]